MRPLSSLRARFGRALAERLDRLRQTLDELGSRLHEAIAAAIGEQVGGAVRAAIRALLDEVSERPMLSTRPQWSPQRHSSFWSTPDDPAEDDLPDFLPEDREDDYGATDRDQFLDSLPQARPDVESHRGRFAQALAFGCQVISWWLYRPVGQLSLLTAVTLGVLAAALAYLGRNLLAARTSLARSVFGLASLADLIRAAAQALIRGG